ncbi:MAG: redoxin domain-containing protein [Verrucomicrobiales bacterium]|nr:redoxin domain-containing protein [Verrucomicrobiales bacterium]
MRKFPPTLIFCVALAVCPAIGQEKKTEEPAKEAPDEAETTPEEGHSVHGEIFNEGPRQAAVLIGGTGHVNFEITTKSPEAQKFFNQGIGQLHGYWDFEAERSFRQAAALDPECAMAYWGMGMANFGNNTRGKGFADEAAKRRDQASEREKMWIDSLAAYFKDVKADKKKRLRDLMRAMEKIAQKYPDDIEAQAFVFRQLYYNHRNGHPMPSVYVADLLGEKIHKLDPNHPVHHYRIHIWDRENAEKALHSASMGGPSAPGIAHMWHMPGHIYSKLHRYQDGAWYQEASARVDHAYMMRFMLIPDQIHNFAHNNEWCIRNLNHLGRLQDAITLSKNMAELPRRPKFTKKEDPKTYNPSGSSWQYGRQRLRESLFRYEEWDKLIALADTNYLKPDGKGLTQDDHDRFQGIAKFESGDAEGGKVHLDAIEKRLNEEKKKRDDAVTKAEQKAKDGKKDKKGIDAAKKAAERNFSKKIAALQTRFDELTVYAAVNQKPEPDLAKAHEFLPKLKNLAKERHAMLWSRAGKHDEAVKVAGEAVSGGKNQVKPLVFQVRILAAAGKKDEAKKAFESLRTVAGFADTDLAIFEPLKPIAKEFGFPEKWQMPAPSKDMGEQPSLDSLGPFRWTPPKAPDFKLTNIEDKPVDQTSLGGKPTVMIFYLGKGCKHCMEQLNAFAPMHEKFQEAGIDIVAVSTDSVDGLKQTFREAEPEETGEGETKPAADTENPFPFPLLSDTSLDAFKAFRAYDDFEKMALHGTYLIDGKGQIRWLNISYEPFMHPGWLLEECERLLSFGDS